jgi:hypothetical protein
MSAHGHDTVAHGNPDIRGIDSAVPVELGDHVVFQLRIRFHSVSFLVKSQAH